MKAYILFSSKNNFSLTNLGGDNGKSSDNSLNSTISYFQP